MLSPDMPSNQHVHVSFSGVLWRFHHGGVMTISLAGEETSLWHFCPPQRWGRPGLKISTSDHGLLFLVPSPHLEAQSQSSYQHTKDTAWEMPRGLGVLSPGTRQRKQVFFIIPGCVSLVRDVCGRNGRFDLVSKAPLDSGPALLAGPCMMWLLENWMPARTPGLSGANLCLYSLIHNLNGLD